MNLRLPLVAFVVLGWLGPVLAQTTGKLTGTVRHQDTREPVPGANVRLQETAFGSAADHEGRYEVPGLPPGPYTVLVTAVGYENFERVITIRPDQTLVIDFFLKDEAVQVGEVLVYGASLRRERMTEAPAAVSVVDVREIVRQAGHGQLPYLLANEPGVDVVQSGMFDFNINTRGFNSTLNRRLLVLMDGRDLAIVLLGAQEWNGLTVPLEDLGRIEVVRGPGSALYGANAFNGVINISTPSPRTIPGTKVTLAGGNRGSYRGDVRHAGLMDEHWSYRVNFGHYGGFSWSQARPDTAPAPLFADGPFEYAGFLPPLHAEARKLNEGRVSSSYGSMRVDYDYANGNISTIEAGASQVENEVYVTGIGRVQVTKALKPFTRINHTAPRYNIQLWYSGRNSGEPQYSLGTGLPLFETSSSFHAEGQYNFSMMDNALLFVVGASHRQVSVDTKDKSGVQSLLLEARDDNTSGLYGQAEYRPGPKWKFVVAARWDRSTIHDYQISPKAALVWSPSTEHSFRATFNSAFQAPNYSELSLNILHPFRSQAYFGNPDLKVEKILGGELGYKGVFQQTFFVTADVYFNRLSDFITDLAGGVNPAYPRDPQPIPGDTKFVRRSILSYGNAGIVYEGGGELGINYYLSDNLSVNLNGAYLYYDVIEKNQYDQLLPNAPEYRVNGGITYVNPGGLDVSLRGKYVPAYPWAAGIYFGNIKSYSLLDLAVNYRLNFNTSAGLNVTNLLDNVHYEVFGGSLIGRRIVATVTFQL